MNYRNIETIMPFRTYAPGEPTGDLPPVDPPATTPPVADPPATDPPRAGDDAAMWRRKAETAQAKLSKLEEAEQARRDADLSESEKLKVRAETAETRAAKLETEHLKLTVANETGLSLDVIEFITGTDEESIRAQASKLATLIPQSPTRAGSITAPAAGQAPSLDERISQAERSGNRGESLTLKIEKMRAGQS